MRPAERLLGFIFGWAEDQRPSPAIQKIQVQFKDRLMSSEILINVNSGETRVALLENGVLVELYIERSSEKGITGNIYKGRVVRVLPGMQAAFVDIGLEKAAFLYVTDVHQDFEDLEQLMRSREEEGNGPAPIEEEEVLNLEIPFHIEDLLHEGRRKFWSGLQEPLGAKGARITSHISLPGRHLVLMPMVDHIGISRRISRDLQTERQTPPGNSSKI